MVLSADRVLCVVAHPDDEVLGCGGTLARLAAEGADVRVLLPVARTDPRGLKHWSELLEQFDSAVRLLGATPLVPECQLTEEAAESDTKALHELVLPAVEWSETVITHWPGDVHQVHRQVARAVEIATRPFRRRRGVLFMEVPTSSDQSVDAAFKPNLHVLLTAEHLERKLDAMRLYVTEHDPGRDPADVELLARLRGRQIGTEAAEGFMIARAFL